MSAYTEEQRIFINDMRMDNKTIKEIQDAFSAKWNRVPAPVTVSKYGNYDRWGRGSSPDVDEKILPKEEEPKEEEKESGVMEIKVDDKRKIKVDGKDQIIHFSDGEIDEKAFNKIVALRGTTQAETWEFLRKCGEKGYTKINMTTGEISQ